MTTASQETTSRRWVLPFLAAFVAVLATLLSSASASAATTPGTETRVGAHNVAVDVLVEPPQSVSAGERLGNDRPGVVTAVATGVAAKSADEGVEGGLNLFKWNHPTSTRPTGWRDGDYMLHLPNQGTPKANWAQNSSRLRSVMRSGKPIYESYVDSKGNLMPTTGFLNAERNVLINRGWTYDPGAQAWFAP